MVLVEGKPEFENLKKTLFRVVNLCLIQGEKIEKLEKKNEKGLKETKKIAQKLEKHKKNEKKLKNDEKRLKIEKMLEQPSNSLFSHTPRVYFTNSKYSDNSDKLNHSSLSIFSYFMQREPQTTSSDSKILSIIEYFNDKLKFTEHSLNFLLSELSSSTISKALSQVSYLKAFQANYQNLLEIIKTIYSELFPSNKNFENFENTTSIIKEIVILKTEYWNFVDFRRKVCELVGINHECKDQDLFDEVEAVNIFKRLFEVDKDCNVRQVIEEIFIFVHEMKAFLEVIIN